MTDRPTAEQRREPRTAAGVTRDWLSGAMLVGMVSVESGKYEGQSRYEAAADEAIRWLADAGMRLTIEAEASREAEGLLRRLIAVIDAAHVVWTEPVPEDSIAALFDAKEWLAAREKEERS